MLTIERALVDKIIAHARADHPDEACGIVAGPQGSDRPTRFIPMTNAERSPTYHRFDDQEWYWVDREMDDNDEEPIVHYHSHTSTEAYPSRTDIDYLRSSLADPRIHRVLVSTRAPDEVEFRSYLLVDGEVVEEEVEIVESYG
ncbi:Mov34/MPN/PAD-1 family protein [Actinomadura chibensis]|uniref:M67 family metallopeptidase n=1 Tax=Actinomadura chibensis TaxID=392828 RepID=A0A5D0NU73_9ACTN|nr:M67 family metallopeptidase [Actinomadura chibensis]TYB47718.1 M67 family metallopeptidase [Actinomadura chibensis]